jgi:hypothetical protein
MGRIGVIDLSEGSAIHQRLTILAGTIRANFMSVVVDRQCRSPCVAARHRLPCQLVAPPDAWSFSTRASDIFRDRRADLNGLAMPSSAALAWTSRALADIFEQRVHIPYPSVVFRG